MFRWKTRLEELLAFLDKEINTKKTKIKDKIKELQDEIIDANDAKTLTDDHDLDLVESMKWVQLRKRLAKIYDEVEYMPVAILFEISKELRKKLVTDPAGLRSEDVSLSKALSTYSEYAQGLKVKTHGRRDTEALIEMARPKYAKSGFPAYQKVPISTLPPDDPAILEKYTREVPAIYETENQKALK